MALRYNANLEVQYPEVTFLGQIDDATRAVLKAVWTVKSFDSGQLIMDVEDNPGDIMFLLDGAARVANFSAKGREVSFSNIQEGDCFGEFSTIDGAPRSASVLAMGPARVALIPDAVFRDLLQRYPDLGMVMMHRLVEKLRDLTRRVSEFTALKADDRIRLEIHRQFVAQRAADGSALLNSPPTQAALAAFVFTNREAVAREIGRMKRNGLIHRRGRALFAPSVDAIEDYLDTAGEG
ncbi:MAG: Crp/Fnr family transcriptional regulator [Pseudomonadota bacterium]